MKRRTILRDYQLELLDRLHLAWEKHQSVMAQMPTGVGKTILLAEEIKNERLKIKNEELAADTMHNGSSDFSPFHLFTFSLIIIDEAHHALAKTYKMLWDRWRLQGSSD